MLLFNLFRFLFSALFSSINMYRMCFLSLVYIFLQARIALLQDEVSTVGNEVDALKVLLIHFFIVDLELMV